MNKYPYVAFVNAAFIMGPFETIEGAKNWCERYNAAENNPANAKAKVAVVHSAERVLQIREEHARSAKAPA
jgi:hypothetical protein